MTIIGFTGTRAPGEVSDHRRDLIQVELITRFSPGAEFHHGDCLGMDELAFEWARGIGYLTVAHPCDRDVWRAFTESDVVHNPRGPLVRNRDIVRVARVVLAVPQDPDREQWRGSGTWSTIRYARQSGKPTVVL